MPHQVILMLNGHDLTIKIERTAVRRLRRLTRCQQKTQRHRQHPEMLAYNAHGFNEGATSHDYFIFNNKWAEYKRQ